MASQQHKKDKSDTGRVNAGTRSGEELLTQRMVHFPASRSACASAAASDPLHIMGARWKPFQTGVSRVLCCASPADEGEGGPDTKHRRRRRRFLNVCAEEPQAARCCLARDAGSSADARSATCFGCHHPRQAVVDAASDQAAPDPVGAVQPLTVSSSRVPVAERAMGTSETLLQKLPPLHPLPALSADTDDDDEFFEARTHLSRSSSSSSIASLADLPKKDCDCGALEESAACRAFIGDPTSPFAFASCEESPIQARACAGERSKRAKRQTPLMPA